MNRYLLLITFTFLLLSCNSEREGNERVKIVCTTGMIGDAISNLVKDSADVEVLMGPGVDPHLYKATHGDIANLTRANIIVYNGLHLEGKMGEIFGKLKKQKLVIAAAETLPENRLMNSSDYDDAYDPHIWFDVDLWSEAVFNVADTLMAHYPQWKEYITSNRNAYMQELSHLHNYCLGVTAAIPDSQRILITAHDAFKYFGRAYNLEVRGLQGISTTAEYGLRDISNLVNFIVDNKINAIFVESSVPLRSIQAVMEGCKKRGHSVKLGGELYSDAMGEKDSEAGTYTGMLTHNVNTITEALK